MYFFLLSLHGHHSNTIINLSYINEKQFNDFDFTMHISQEGYLLKLNRYIILYIILYLYTFIIYIATYKFILWK